jgi:hypothetical protein
MTAETTLVFLSVGSYDADMTWKDGSPIRFVDAYDLGAREFHRMTVDQKLEGELPSVIGQAFTSTIRFDVDREKARMKKRLLACSPGELVHAA